MLHPVGELGQHGIGDVAGALSDEVDAHAPGADQLHRLLDLLQQHGGRVPEQHVGLVEEEHQLGLVHIARLRQALKQLRQHPQQEAGVQGGVLHQLDAVQHVDHAAAVLVGAHPVADVQGGLAEEQLAALLLQGQQRPQDGRCRLGRDVAVGHHVLGAVLVDVGQHGTQILQVDQQQALVVGDAEHDVQDALLGGGQAQDPAEKLRPHVADGGADGVAALLIDIPEGGGVRLIGKGVPDAELVDALLHALIADAGGADARHVALHVAQEHGHARVGEGFRHHLHGDGLAGAAGACDQTVAVAHVQRHLHPLAVRQTHIDPAVFVHIAVLQYVFASIIRQRPPPRKKEMARHGSVPSLLLIPHIRNGYFTYFVAVLIIKHCLFEKLIVIL